MTPIAIVLAAVAVAGGFGYAISYNRLVARRHAVSDAWATVEVELQRRHELIPPLVESVRAAAAHERQLLSELLQCNDTARVAPHTAAAANHWEPPLVTAIGAVLALRERYPELDAHANFVALQDELTTTEDRLAAARRFYNHRVTQLNTAVAAFPSAIVARRHRIVAADFYDAD